MPHPGLEPGPSDPESSALTTGPLTPPEWFSQQREQSWYLLFLSEILRVFEELNDIVFQCVGNREFDWSEICCCYDNFITCHEKSAAVTILSHDRRHGEPMR